MQGHHPSLRHSPAPTHQLGLGHGPDDLVEPAEDPGEPHVARDAVVLLHQEEDVPGLLHLQRAEHSASSLRAGHHDSPTAPRPLCTRSQGRYNRTSHRPAARSRSPPPRASRQPPCPPGAPPRALCPAPSDPASARLTRKWKAPVATRPRRHAGEGLRVGLRCAGPGGAVGPPWVPRAGLRRSRGPAGRRSKSSVSRRSRRAVLSRLVTGTAQHAGAGCWASLSTDGD